MMRRVLAIAGNTYRENIRDKILYNLILFALIMILSSLALGQLTLGNEDKVILDLGLSSISIFGMLIAIFIGIGLVYKELEKRTVYALLAKPVHRYELILGKYLGLLFTLLVNLAIMTVGLELALLYAGRIGAGGYLRLLAGRLPDFSFAGSDHGSGAAVLHLFHARALRPIHILSLDHRALRQRPAQLRRTDEIGIGKMDCAGSCIMSFPTCPTFRSWTAAALSRAPTISSRSIPLPLFWATLYCVLYCALLLSLAVCNLHAPGFQMKEADPAGRSGQSMAFLRNLPDLRRAGQSRCRIGSNRAGRTGAGSRPALFQLSSGREKDGVGL